MKSLIMYREFGDETLPSMKDFFEESCYEGQEIIADYLDNGRTTYVMASRVTDVFTGEIIPVHYEGKTDGEYSWSSVLSYYVRKYNLRLLKEFEEKVLNQ